MPCYSCGNKTEPSSSGTYNNVQVLNHGDCEGIGKEVLVMFVSILNCAKVSNRLGISNITENEANDTIALLNSWITIKELDPGSCEPQAKFPLVQSIVQKAISTGTC